jgi:hypothetical protein
MVRKKRKRWDEKLEMKSPRICWRRGSKRRGKNPRVRRTTTTRKTSKCLSFPPRIVRQLVGLFLVAVLNSGLPQGWIPF